MKIPKWFWLVAILLLLNTGVYAGSEVERPMPTANSQISSEKVNSVTDLPGFYNWGYYSSRQEDIDEGAYPLEGLAEGVRAEVWLFEWNRGLDGPLVHAIVNIVPDGEATIGVRDVFESEPGVKPVIDWQLWDRSPFEMEEVHEGDFLVATGTKHGEYSWLHGEFVSLKPAVFEADDVFIVETVIRHNGQEALIRHEEPALYTSIKGTSYMPLIAIP